MLTIVAAPLPRIQLATGVPVTVPVVEDKDEAAFFVVGAKKSEWNKLHKLKSKGYFRTNSCRTGHETVLSDPRFTTSHPPKNVPEFAGIIHCDFLLTRHPTAEPTTSLSLSARGASDRTVDRDGQALRKQQIQASRVAAGYAFHDAGARRGCGGARAEFVQLHVVGIHIASNAAHAVTGSGPD